MNFKGKDIDKIIMAFENILKLLRKNKDFEEKLEKIIYIISKIELIEEQFNNFVGLVLSNEVEIYDIFFNENSDVSNHFINILYKNKDKLKKDTIEKIFEKLYTLKNINEILVNNLTYCYDKFGVKLQKSDMLDKFLKNSNIIIKSHFLRVAEGNYFEELKNKILSEMKENLNTEIYNYLILYEYICIDIEFEMKILNRLDILFETENELKNYRDKKEFLNSFMMLLLNGFYSKEFLKNLKNLSNKNLNKFIEEENLKVIWKYALNQEDYDFKDFTERELEMFSKVGIKHLIEKKKDNFLRLIKNYAKDKIKNDRILEAYFEVLTEEEEEK